MSEPPERSGGFFWAGSGCVIASCDVPFLCEPKNHFGAHHSIGFAVAPVGFSHAVACWWAAHNEKTNRDGNREGVHCMEP